MLLVYRLDRFTRRIRDLAVLMEELEKAEVHFRSATEPFDTSTPAGQMLVQMLGVFAEFEQEIIIDRVRNGMERKAAKGKWTGGPVPYGYQLDRTLDLPVPNPAEATVVRQIFTACAETRVGPGHRRRAHQPAPENLRPLGMDKHLLNDQNDKSRTTGDSHTDL